jgi:prophage regulatory protein
MAQLAKQNPPTTLPLTGKSRFKSFEPLTPFSREKFRQLSRAGLAPQPERMGVRCTFYDNGELHRFLADPLNYRAKGFAAPASAAATVQTGGAK